jgi:restriction system protein
LAFWVVRAGNEGQQEKASIENKLVTVGWNSLPDMSGIEKAWLKKLWKKYILFTS